MFVLIILHLVFAAYDLETSEVFKFIGFEFAALLKCVLGFDLLLNLVSGLSLFMII